MLFNTQSDNCLPQLNYRSRDITSFVAGSSNCVRAGHNCSQHW